MKQSFNVSTAKTIFSIDFPKNRFENCSAGAHTGAPLRLYWRCFYVFVGEEGGLLTTSKSLCPPASEIMLDFPIMSSKMTFLQWNHYMILVSIAYLSILWSFKETPKEFASQIPFIFASDFGSKYSLFKIPKSLAFFQQFYLSLFSRFSISLTIGLFMMLMRLKSNTKRVKIVLCVSFMD